MSPEDSSQGPPVAPPPPPEPPPAPAAQTPSGPASENRGIWVVLSYLGLLALIPLLVEKEDREVQWHAKHGLVLLVAEVVIFIGLQVATMILGAVSGGLGCLVGLLFPFLMLAILVIHVICIVKGIKGDRFIIPGISDFANRF